MKNVYLFLMMMMCTVCAFTGCSDEEDDAPVCPVTGVVLPKQAQKAGSEFQIAGNGFSSTCEIYLRAKQDVKAEVTERLASTLKVMIPVTLTSGEYDVVLKQEGEWTIGKITVEEKVVKVVKKITLKGDDDYFYEFTYDDATGRILKMEESYSDSKAQYESFVWEGNKLTVSVFFASMEGDYYEDPSRTYEYTLNEKGMVTSGLESTWHYDAEGKYLSKIDLGETEDEGSYEVIMDGDKVKTFKNISPYYELIVDFTYEGKIAAPENNTNLDLLSFVINEGVYLRDFEFLYAHLAGACGERAAYLPLNMKDTPNEIDQDCNYKTDGDGFVTAIEFSDGFSMLIEYK